MSARTPQITPDWLLERYALGELPPAQMSELESLLARDTALAARLAELATSNAAILAEHPAAEVARAVRARAAESGPRTASRRGLWLLAPALAAIALLAVVLPTAHDPTQTPGAGSDELRAKGLEPHLVAFRVHGHKAERLTPQAVLRRGDVVQLKVVAAGRRFGAVVSIDGRGGVTLHLPESASRSAALADGELALPHAYELDDAPSFERFVFVTAARSFEVAEVARAAAAVARDADPEHAPLALPVDLEQHDLLVRKEVP